MEYFPASAVHISRERAGTMLVAAAEQEKPDDAVAVCPEAEGRAYVQTKIVKQ